ncbi:helix-turn-helix domain-containing protein [Streptococcus equi subsp. zooepidemicus]|uniref:helix-turn-helix domain-containing protein n=1 Tax=Streptococcus equi TaxID=1336 RepID=UPI001E29EFDA|nr:helix-turn-helix domain-containing protein [Streptococcus equi]MCD3465547.1 helix-turn-helix domain-containing protein [Streptococcus equi subsp. zooepidemicus]
MLDYYLERDIVERKLILAVLLTEKEITLDSLCSQTSITPRKAKEYLNQINALFDKDLSITVLKSGITCEFDPNNKEKYFHSIYASSDTLKILKFLLMDNYRTKCLTTFIRRQFISKSKAYHLVNKLKGYLQSIHLGIDDYRVIGDEYRIRYLIAMLHKEYGFAVYEMTPKDMEIIHAFIFSTPTRLKPSVFLDKKFYLFDILLMLSWKRQNYDVSLPQLTLFDRLKELSIFEQISCYAKQEIETRTQVVFDSGDLDYLYLVYLTVDSSFLMHYWNDKQLRLVYNILEEDPLYKELVNRLEMLFGRQLHLRDQMYFLLPFFRRCLFQLHDLISFQDYYSKRYQGSQLLLEKVEEQIKDWLMVSYQSETLSPGHLHFMCLHLEQMLELSLPPVEVIIVENKRALGDVLSYFVISSIPSYKVNITRINMLTDSLEDYEQAPDFVITSDNILPFLEEQQVFPDKSVLIGMSMDYIKEQGKTVVKSILNFHRKHYEQLLEQLLIGDGVE